MLLFLSTLYLGFTGELTTLILDLKAYPKLIISQSFLDNLAWVSYALATTFAPIAIATAISESYIVLAVLLGIFINKERLQVHQIFGVIVTLLGVIVLSTFTV